MSYDYMVLAGTQGLQNHRKKDRVRARRAAQIAGHVDCEGGGGRPGDTDGAESPVLIVWPFNFGASFRVWCHE